VTPLSHDTSPTPAQYTVKFDETGSVLVEGPGVERRSQIHTFFNDLGISLAFGALLPPHLADLLDITVAVYVADRLCPRRPRGAPRAHLDELWQRRLTVRLPLRGAAEWSPARRTKLEALLGFLTDDEWTFKFTNERRELRSSETQASFLPDVPKGDVSAALLSGGLDSLAGVVNELVKHPERTIIAFSARTNHRIGIYQRKQVRRLTELFGQRLRHVPVELRIEDREPHAYDREDPSQRTRGFVFQIFGAVTAVVAGSRVLHVYENGIGAINLPYSLAQLGAQATRATHPITVGLVSDLLSDVIGEPFRVTLPHQFTTKAEMCAVLHQTDIRSLIELTISCDKFPQRVAGRPQCGICPSCLLTRQSLLAAGLRLPEESGRFRHDIYTISGPGAVARMYDYRVMSAQAGALVIACASGDPWAALVRRYPILFDVAADHIARTRQDLRPDVVALYARYSVEWQQFGACVRESIGMAA